MIRDSAAASLCSWRLRFGPESQGRGRRESRWSFFDPAPPRPRPHRPGAWFCCGVTTWGFAGVAADVLGGARTSTVFHGRRGLGLKSRWRDPLMPRVGGKALSSCLRRASGAQAGFLSAATRGHSMGEKTRGCLLALLGRWQRKDAAGARARRSTCRWPACWPRTGFIGLFVDANRKNTLPDRWGGPARTHPPSQADSKAYIGCGLQDVKRNEMMVTIDNRVDSEWISTSSKHFSR
jgi:hypothetical protein